MYHMFIKVAPSMPNFEEFLLKTGYQIKAVSSDSVLTFEHKQHGVVLVNRNANEVKIGGNKYMPHQLFLFDQTENRGRVGIGVILQHPEGS